MNLNCIYHFEDDRGISYLLRCYMYHVKSKLLYTGLFLHRVLFVCLGFFAHLHLQKFNFTSYLICSDTVYD